MTRISGRTRVFGVLGQPVSHSLSPSMYNAAFHVLGLDAVYVALPCDAERLPGLMASLGAAGGGGNVTIPHKATAASVVDELRGPTPTACNTFWEESGKLIGDNTDVDGVLGGVDTLEAPQSHWLVVGTGGSARGVLAAARARGVGIAVQSRSPDRARAFLAEAAALGVAVVPSADCAVVINATPLGLGPDDPYPIEPDAIPAATAVLDLVYAVGGTRWVRALRARGVRALDGRVVLVRQGVVAFTRWFPDIAPPFEVMRAAVSDALG